MGTKTKKSKQKKSGPAKAEITIHVKQEILPPVAPALPTPADMDPKGDGKKLMIPQTWLSEKQVTHMMQNTPPQFIYERPAKGGGKWKYVTASYVTAALNFIFGWNWDFEIVDQGKEGSLVWVKGKLTVKSSKGEQVSKMQFGRADVKMKDGKPLDYGNDLKAAASDSLKKCASMLGIASDIYGKEEYKREANIDVDLAPRTPPTPRISSPATLKPGQVKGPDGKGVWECSAGAEILTEAEYIYSMKNFKKPLCREHQKNAKTKQ